MSETCIFQTLYACEKRKDFITKISRDRLKKVRDLNIDVYQDAIHENISYEIATDDGTDDYVLQGTMHKQCVDTYTYYKSVKKRKASNDAIEVSTKRLRSSDAQFNFHRNCFLCGHECSVVRDPKNPSRFREAYLCLSAEDGKLMNKDIFIRKLSLP